MRKQRANRRNKPIDPRQIPKTSRIPLWFECPAEECKKKFQLSPFDVSMRNLWCPHCFLRSNKSVADALRKIAQTTGFKFIINPDIDWSPECFFLAEENGFYKIIVRILPPDTEDQDEKQKSEQAFLEHQLDVSARANDILVARFTAAETAGGSDAWLKSFTDYLSRLGITVGEKRECISKKGCTAEGRPSGCTCAKPQQSSGCENSEHRDKKRA